jgi:hypothetical protein
LCAGLLVLASKPSEAKDPLPTGTSAKLVAADIALLQKGLETPPTAKGPIKGLKAVSMLLALNAQNNADAKDADKLAGVRDVALQIAAALEGGKVADAKKLLDGLKDPKAGDPKKVIKLHEQHKFSLDEVMTILGSTRAGGLNIENDFKEKEIEKTIKDPKKVELHGARIALIGQYALDLPPSDANNDKKKKLWADLCKEMVKAGSDLAAEAGKAKPEADAIKKKIAVVNKNCADCHNEFRK